MLQSSACRVLSSVLPSSRESASSETPHCRYSLLKRRSPVRKACASEEDPSCYKAFVARLTGCPVEAAALAGCSMAERTSTSRNGHTTARISGPLCCRQRLSASARRLRRPPRQSAQPSRRRRRAWLLSWSSVRSRSAGCSRRLPSAHGRLLRSDGGAQPQRIDLALLSKTLL